jgi:hypothetical protein
MAPELWLCVAKNNWNDEEEIGITAALTQNSLTVREIHVNTLSRGAVRATRSGWEEGDLGWTVSWGPNPVTCRCLKGLMGTKLV